MELIDFVKFVFLVSPVVTFVYICLFVVFKILKGDKL